jgi:hypothetical protein
MTRKPEPRIKSRKVLDYNSMLVEIAGLLESARRASVRATNAIMTAKFGKGFSSDNLKTMCLFYRTHAFNASKIRDIVSEIHANRFRGPVSSLMIAYRDKSHG